MYNTEFTANQIENVRIKALELLENAPKNELMKVSTTNRKLHHLAKALGLYKTQVVAIDGLAGYTCPFADVCFAKVVTDDNGKRKLENGKSCEFVCYAAKLEAVYTNVYDAHKHNTDIVDEFSRNKDVEGLAAFILASIWAKSPSIKRMGGVVRWHSSGDFHKSTYVQAASLVALAAPEIEFFGYSKSPWVVQALTNGVNSHMVHSHGSKFDEQADQMELPQNFVRCDDTQFADVPTACPTSMVSDDYFFIKAQQSFATNVH
jgi:hypothetical protein